MIFLDNLSTHSFYDACHSVERSLAADGAHDWRTIWLIPAALAVGVALFFAALFRERETAEAAEVPQGA